MRRQIAFRGVCTADCNVRVRMVLWIRGRKLGPFILSGSFQAGQSFRAFVTINRAALRSLRRYRKRSRFITSIRATEIANANNVDVDRRTFRFVRG